MSNAAEGDQSNYPARFNFEDKFRLNERAQDLRQELIAAAFNIFQEFHIEDITTRERMNVGRYALWLTVDDFEIPSKDGEPQPSMSFAVESPEDHEPPERLKFHIPVPQNFDRDSIEAVEELDMPDTVYAERIVMLGEAVGRTTVRYAISRDHSSMYRTISDTQDEEQLYPSDEAMWDELNRGYDSGIGLVATINEDLINWQVVKQRLLIQSEDGSVVARDI